MKAKMKWLSIVLTLCLTLSGIVLVASAEGETTRTVEATNGGIQALLVTSKNVYSAEETIDATVSIGNLGGVDVSNVKISITSPMKPAQENGSLDKTCEKLGAAQLMQNRFDLLLGDLGDNPYSGMDIQFVIALVAMVVSAAGLAILLITGNIRINKTFCLLLLAGVMLVSLIPNVRAAETEENKVEVAKLIKVGDRLINLTATVTWEEAAAPVITRADMEAAVSEILWDYYMKDVWVQYDSTSFNHMVSHFHGGFNRLDTHMSTLEDANSHDNLYSVCSNYPWIAYYEALGFPLFGYCLNAQSENIWAYSGTTLKDGQENDMIVARWHGYGGGYTTTWHDGVHGGYNEEQIKREEGYLSHDKCFDTFQEIRDFIYNWEENLRPGDIIHLPGHILVYAGNGYVLQSVGSGKFDTDYCYDLLEKNGSVSAQTVKECFFPDSKYGTSYYRLDRYIETYIDGEYVSTPDVERTTRIAVVRPLNILTIPDGDNDPSNDILDVDFVYNGVDKLVWQYEFDKVPLAHSGYTIQPSAYTRMQYPGMNIDRTVNITPYGTATKGETITYTVAIYNESNNAKYVDSKRIGGDEDYAGVDYKGLPITETLPANVELVEAKGATIIGDTMYWNVDIAAGECVKVSYTVKVTGEIGDQIVCGGGWVGAIPSNTIVNTIGGKKLSAEAIANLIEFYEVGKDVWNSNEEGYKISAALNNTEFAERIYNAAAGLDLDIPDAQTLLDILFTQEHISVPRGMYGMNASSAEGWLYTLNDTTADADNQIWRDMVINGYFGGTWVWTNNFDPDVRRVDDPRVDYLEPGDIIVNMTLSSSNGLTQQARTVTAWQVLVYMGDGYFASLNSDGVMNCMQGPRNTLPCLVADVFVALRPSQVYENINEDVPTFTGSVADLTDADMAWESTSAPTELRLNSLQRLELSLMGPDNISGNSNRCSPAMIGYIYNKLDLDVVTNGTQGMGTNEIMDRLFNDVPSDSEAYAMFGHESHLLEYPEKGYEGIYNMLMNFDGRAFVDGNPLTSFDQLQVGDAILVVQRDAGITITMIYQGRGLFGGNHRFLAGIYSPTGKLNYMHFAKTYEFADVNAFNAFVNGHVPTRDGTGETEYYWEGYLVLRPLKAYTNNDAGLIRDISAGALTEREEELLANLKAGDFERGNLDEFPAAVYEAIGIDISSYLQYNVDDTRSKIIRRAGLQNAVDNPDTYDATLGSMVVDGLWGGNEDLFNKCEQIELLSGVDFSKFRVGDILAGRYRNAENTAYIQVIAIYQGNGKFITVGPDNPDAVEIYNFDRLCALNGGAWQYFYVLRPSQLANAN